MIDLNCDMGEVAEAAADQERLMASLTSVNIACGGHAGDERTMRATVEQARRHGLSIGAHPGYPDPANFGRLELDIPPRELEWSIYEQIGALAEIAGELTHVKPHGALYNQAAKDKVLAATIARAVSRFSCEVVMVGLAGSVMLEVFADAGFRTAPEGFADRRYEADGSLRHRRHADALITDPGEAAAQAVALARGGRVRTLCIHGDTPGAVLIAAAVQGALKASEITLEHL